MHPSTRQPVQKGADGVAADIALLPSTAQTQPQQAQDDQQSPLMLEPTSDSTPAQAPLMHFPHCRLEITPIPSTTPNHDGGASTTSTLGKMEQIALPGALVRALLARFEESQSQSQIQQPSQQHQQQPSSHPHPPPAPSEVPRERRTKRAQQQQQQQIQIQRYFDDDNDWVYTRCLLADFTGFREDEAEALSAQGRLCCWASVVLRPLAGDGEAAESAEAEGKWELGFVVQRVGVRDPGSGWCECF